ncbi:MAG: hypothetical protein ACLQVI_28220 [Polyangiaceae bacterium]
MGTPLRLIALIAVATFPLVLATTRASADVSIARSDACTNEGRACDNARATGLAGIGNEFSANGICTKGRCRVGGARPLPKDAGSPAPKEPDSGPLPDAAVGAPPSSPSTTLTENTAADASAKGPSPGGGSSSSSGSGCTIGSIPADALPPFGLMVAGGAIVAVTRRRGARSKSGATP